jgi:hypothetical protein
VLDVGAAIIVLLAWVVLRALIRRWVSARLEFDEISPRQAAIAYSVALAIAPLLLLPWRHSPEDIVFLSFASVLIFVGKYAQISYSLTR